MSDLGIFIDLDHTLILQSYCKSHPLFRRTGLGGLHVLNMDEKELNREVARNCDVPFAVFERGGFRHLVSMRPGAAAFVEAAKTITPDVYCLTMGTSRGQQTPMEALGIYDWFKDVIGRDRYDAVPRFKTGILVDDLPANHPNTERKMEASGVLAERVIEVAPFNGVDDDDELDNALKIIRDITGIVETARSWVLMNCKGNRKTIALKRRYG